MFTTTTREAFMREHARLVMLGNPTRFQRQGQVSIFGGLQREYGAAANVHNLHPIRPVRRLVGGSDA